MSARKYKKKFHKKIAKVIEKNKKIAILAIKKAKQKENTRRWWR